MIRVSNVVIFHNQPENEAPWETACNQSSAVDSLVSYGPITSPQLSSPLLPHFIQKGETNGKINNFVVSNYYSI